MIDFNQIFSKINEYNRPDYYNFLIAVSLFLIISSLYYLRRKKAASLSKVSPKQTIIIHEKNTIIEEKSINDVENFDSSSSGGLLPYLRKLHAKHGAHVLNLSFPNTISIVDPMVVKATLQVGDRPVYLFKFLEPFIGSDNLQIFEAKRAANFRKLIGPSLGHDAIVKKFPIIRDIGVELIEKWEKLVKNDKDYVFKMQEQCLELSLRVVLNLIISINEKNIDVKSYKECYDITLSGLFDKQFGVLDTLREEKLQEAITFMKSFICNLIDQRRKELREINKEKTDAKDFFDILISENDPHTGKPFTEEEIVNFVSSFVMAGYHTTGGAIPYALFSLSQNHDVQIKLQEEIDKTLEGRLPTMNDLSNMEYLTQVIKESLRVHVPGGFAARLMKSETSLSTMVESKDLRIQDDTTIIYPISIYHENPDFFPQPEKFDPTRFSRDRIKDIKPYTYCPFGFGARICPAERFVMVDMKLFICMIMQKFNVELAMKPEDFVKEERFATMAKNDVLIKLIPRS